MATRKKTAARTAPAPPREDPWAVDPLDPLKIPAPLRRDGPKLTREALDRLLNVRQNRVWIMPDRSKFQIVLSDAPPEGESEEGEDQVAKKAKKGVAEATAEKNSKPEVNCVSADLPVEVNYLSVNDGTQTKSFDDMAGFADWFDPRRHVIEGSIPDASMTMISVKERPESVRKKDPRAKGDPAMAATPEGRGAVIKKGRVPKTAAAKPRGVNFKRHKVRVKKAGDKGEGNLYGSVYQAFLDLGLSISAHTKFRALLKKEPTGRMTYEEKEVSGKKGNRYEFVLVEA